MYIDIDIETDTPLYLLPVTLPALPPPCHPTRSTSSLSPYLLYFLPVTLPAIPPL